MKLFNMNRGRRKVKFDEFFFSEDAKLYSFEESLEDIVLNREFYRDKMYCPECEEAKLSFHDAKTPYLSKFPSSHHGEGCSYSYAIASKKKAVEYYENDTNDESIQRKLKSCINILSSTISEKSNLEKNDMSTKNKKARRFTFEDYDGTRLMLRKKRISRGLKNFSNYKEPVLFYGNVYIYWHHSDRYKYIHLKDNKGELICSIKISDKVYEYLDNDIKLLTGDFRRVAFISKMEKKDAGKRIFNNCKLKRSTHLIVEKVIGLT
ncbi:hypothetical protein PNU84_11240 [Turicibacter sanguinis]|nr:hypothetical protein [Turicibacter sanguinis]